jgi:arylamine N-acetyltransferase
MSITNVKIKQPIDYNNLMVDGSMNALYVWKYDRYVAVGGGVSASTNPPLAPDDGATWVDTTEDPPMLKVYDKTNGIWVTAAESAKAWQQWYGTQAEYDALGDYDPDTLYCITG